MMTQYTSGNSVFLEVRELSLYPKSLTKPKTAVMLARMPSQLSPNGFRSGGEVGKVVSDVRAI